MSGAPSKFFGVVLSVGLTLVTVIGISVALDNATRRPPGPYVLMSAVFAGAYLLLMRGPLGKAIARMLDGTSAPDPMLDRSDEIDELLARSADDRLRLLELEDRLDFAERLLSQRSEFPQLPMHRTPV